MKPWNRHRLKEAIESRIAEDREQEWVDGVCAWVCHGGETVYEGCFGYERREAARLTTPKTIFRLASMTKPITAVAVMQCVERGLLDLDASISRYLPLPERWDIARVGEDHGILLQGKSRGPITLRHLLTHTSGIGCGDVGNVYGARITEDRCPDLQSSIPEYASWAIAFEPGSAQDYSPLVAFDLCAAAIERVSGMDYETYLRQKLFDPCDMPDTTFLPNEEQLGRIIDMHQRIEGKGSVRPMPAGCIFENIPARHYLGGGGLVSTLTDYSHFARMLLDRGEYAGRRILSPESVRELSAPQVPASIMGGYERWGLGVRVITDARYGPLKQGAFGWSGAYGTHFWVDPENEICAVYLKNSVWDGGSGAITARHFEQDVAASLETEGENT